MSPTVFSNLNHVHTKFKFSLYIIRKVGRDWLEIWLWFLLIAAKNSFWASAKCSQLCWEWNWECWKLRNRWMAFHRVGWSLLGLISCASISFLCVFPCVSPPGNAALVLRSRLKVKVVKEHREKPTVRNGIEENGVVSANLEKEVGKQIMQFQVRGQRKQKEPV